MRPGGPYRFRAELWEWEGPAAWCFVSLPEEVADDIEYHHGSKAAGFGSIKVQVTVGSTTWQTSVFPDTKRGTYLLPMKKDVRRKESLVIGGPVDVSLGIVNV